MWTFAIRSNETNLNGIQKIINPARIDGGAAQRPGAGE